MLERLRAAIEELEVPADGDGLLEAYRLLDRFAATLSQAVGDFDASGEWGLDGDASAVAWLRHRAGLTPKAAASAVGTARRLRELPVTASAWREGSLSGGQVQAIVANVDDRTAPQFAAQEADLVPMLADLSTSQTAKAMQFWRARAEALVDGADPGAPERAVYLSRGLAGRWALNGDLDPEGGTLLATALRLATTEDGADEPARTQARRRADALVDMARFFLDHQQHVPSGRHRPHLNVVVQYDDLVAGGGGELVDGGLLDGASIRRLPCDASVHRVVTDGRSTILDYGTATRTTPGNLWAALVLRDRHCRHEGCDRPSWWCDAHHVVSVLEGGPTSLDNLVLKCSRHHHLGHERGWQEKLLPDGTLVVTDPAGRTRTTKPPGLVPMLLVA